MEKNVHREWTESATDPLNRNPSHLGSLTLSLNSPNGNNYEQLHVLPKTMIEPKAKHSG